MSTANLDQRYGRTPSRRRLTRILAIGGSSLGAALIIAWAAWTGILVPRPSIDQVTISYDIVSDREVVVQYSVSMTAGETAVCAIAAQSERKAIVGWVTVDVPAGDQFTRTFEQRLWTSERADLGLITDCALT